MRPLHLPDSMDAQEARLRKLRTARAEASKASEARATRNKELFDKQFNKPGRSHAHLVSYKIGAQVKLRNESHTKGEPFWYGPFEIFDTLGKNVYTLVDHRGSLFPHPISGNRLKPVHVRETSLGEPWALPPKLLQEIKQTDLKVSKEVKLRTKKLAKAQARVLPRIRVVGRFATA
ncbi:hypothetical protein CROQUDRAFT_53083 [Cronartium quercuum f. sp. fusiforme G11]|uniref:Uncharacterized protein n=1 Tax=Cronartium quercuum f. sp. fusiforme G11 TaxID=708437 RepID=A0A9P6T620_9BASI|nr:hypothetical protein CROQUDRAFT_53083 [Cronartium quercuum f. sp. fusiforme G11]